MFDIEILLMNRWESEQIFEQTVALINYFKNLMIGQFMKIRLAEKEQLFRKLDFIVKVFSYFYGSLFTRFIALVTMLPNANNAIAFGITIKLLNISDNSHTRSLEARVPRKMNTSAITV